MQVTDRPSCPTSTLPLPHYRQNRLLQSITAISRVARFTHLGLQLVPLTVTLYQIFLPDEITFIILLLGT